MKKGIVITLGVLGVAGLTALLFSFKTKENTTTASGGGSQADSSSSSQFDRLVAMAIAEKSDLFEGAQGAALENMRNTFSSNLTSSERESLITLMGKKESLWSANDKIVFYNLLKKWRGATSAPAPKPVSALSPGTTGPYNPEKDPNYTAKLSEINKWYDKILAVNKARVIPRVIPSKNKLAELFLIWDLSDLKTWISLYDKGSKNRDVRDNYIMDNLQKKYPKSLVGRNVVYTNFSGKNTPNEMANGFSWTI